MICSNFACSITYESKLQVACGMWHVPWVVPSLHGWLQWFFFLTSLLFPHLLHSLRCSSIRSLFTLLNTTTKQCKHLLFLYFLAISFSTCSCCCCFVFFCCHSLCFALFLFIFVRFDATLICKLVSLKVNHTLPDLQAFILYYFIRRL